MRTFVKTAFLSICLVIAGNSLQATAAPCKEAKVVRVSIGGDIFSIPANYEPDLAGLSDQQQKLVQLRKARPEDGPRTGFRGGSIPVYCQGGEQPWAVHGFVIYLVHVLLAEPRWSATALGSFGSISVIKDARPQPLMSLPGDKTIALKMPPTGFGPVVIATPKRGGWSSAHIKVSRNAMLTAKSMERAGALSKNANAFLELNELILKLSSRKP